MARFDRTSLAPAKPAKIYEGWVARTHDDSWPLVYSTGEEYRRADELENILNQIKECKSGRVIHVTNDHPSHLIKADGSDSDAPIIGRILDGYLDDDHVVARILVEDAEAIEMIDSGKVELSLGYTAIKADDNYQTSIKLNHLSLVEAGRCGTCELRADSAERFLKSTGGKLVAQDVPHANLSTMLIGDLETKVKLTLDSDSEKTLSRLESAFANLQSMSSNKIETVIETPPEAHVDCLCKSGADMLNKDSDPMDELKAQLDAAVKALSESQARVTALETELSTKVDAASSVEAQLAVEKAESKLEVEKTRADKLEVELKDAKEALEAAKLAKTDAEKAEFDARVDARVELLDKASKVGIEGAKAMSDVEIKLAVIKKVRNKEVKADSDAKFVDGMFVIAMDQFEESQTSVSETLEAIQETVEQAAEVLDSEDPLKREQEIRERTLVARKDRWKKN